MACNEDLKKKPGAVYPRTCADCGLGPCKKYPAHPKSEDPSQAFAALILTMNYGALVEISGELSQMIEEGVRDRPKTPHEFASILYDWAEAH